MELVGEENEYGRLIVDKRGTTMQTGRVDSEGELERVVRKRTTRVLEGVRKADSEMGGCRIRSSIVPQQPITCASSIFKRLTGASFRRLESNVA